MVSFELTNLWQYATKKIFRLLSILNQLDKRGKVFVRSLAGEFNVSVRSVQRDLKLLLETGFPVDKAPETGAYNFSEGFQIGKSTLNEKEWALLLSFEDIAKKIGSPFDGLMRSIVQKNLHPSAAYDWFYFKSEESASVPDLEGLLSVLIEAIRNREIIIFTYSVYSEYQTRVKPFKIIRFNGFWYLLGENTTDQVIKKYALDRIKKPKGTGKYFTEVPADLNKTLDESFNVWFGPKRGKKVVVEVSEEVADYFKRRKWFPNQEIIEEKKNGHLVISYLVSDYREISPFLKSWIPNLWVIKPQELRKKLREDMGKGIKIFSNAGLIRHAYKTLAKITPSVKGVLAIDKLYKGGINMDSEIKNTSGKVLYKFTGTEIKETSGKTLFKITGNEIKATNGKTLYKFTDDEIKEPNGKTVYKYTGSEIKETNGTVLFKYSTSELKTTSGKTLYKFKGRISVPVLFALSLI